MQYSIWYSVAICYYFIVILDCDKFDPDYDLNQDQFISKYGYDYENYDIKTEDNYILSIIRIPSRRKPIEHKPDKNPILIGHGLGSCSFHWLIPGPNKSLPLRLADLGHDVWLTNSRGNSYSRKHLYLNPDNMTNSYWNFSFHESGYFDLPAVINFILNKTKKEKIIYIGMSQGTTNFFVMASTKPEYNNKIQLAIAMAPVAFMTNPPGIVIKLLKFNEGLYNRLAKIIKEIQIPKLLLNVLSYACRNGSPFFSLCFRIVVFIFSSDSKQIDKVTLSTFITNISGVSAKIGSHYIQLMKTDSFQHFDYGRKLNMIYYGQVNPPPYNLKLVTAPVKLVYTVNDIFINVNDVKKLMEFLPNVIEAKKVQDEMFGYIDFTIAKDVNNLVYDDIIDTINNYNLKVNELN